MNDELKERLIAGEKIIWSGGPKQGLMLTARDTFLVPFSLLWGAFAIFWETSVLRAPGAPAFFPIFGAFFVLTGLYLIIGRFFVDAWIRRRIAYAVTNRRILIARGQPFRKFVAISLDKLPKCDLTEGANGSGTILFGERIPFWSQQSFASWMPSLEPTPQFIAIGDASKVFDQIQRLLSSNEPVRGGVGA